MAALLTIPVGPRDHVRASTSATATATASITLVEYGDFECPQCGTARPIVARLEDRFKDRLRFVFRHFPLTSSHPHAQHAAEAAEWAATRGAFWPLHDALYDAQKALSDRRIVELASGLGLPGAELEKAWAEHAFIPRVKEDFASGIASGVTGTPAFFINGVRQEGPWGETALADAVERAANGQFDADARADARG